MAPLPLIEAANLGGCRALPLPLCSALTHTAWPLCYSAPNYCCPSSLALPMWALCSATALWAHSAELKTNAYFLCSSLVSSLDWAQCQVEPLTLTVFALHACFPTFAALYPQLVNSNCALKLTWLLVSFWPVFTLEALLRFGELWTVLHVAFWCILLFRLFLAAFTFVTVQLELGITGYILRLPKEPD